MVLTTEQQQAVDQEVKRQLDQNRGKLFALARMLKEACDEGGFCSGMMYEPDGSISLRDAAKRAWGAFQTAAASEDGPESLQLWDETLEGIFCTRFRHGYLCSRKRRKE